MPPKLKPSPRRATANVPTQYAQMTAALLNGTLALGTGRPLSTCHAVGPVRALNVDAVPFRRSGDMATSHEHGARPVSNERDLRCPKVSCTTS